MLISDTACVAEVRDELHQVQNELFNIGGYLATAMPAGEERVCTSLVGGEKIQSLEEWIDALDEQTPKIRAFVLPGGSEAASKAHVCRGSMPQGRKADPRPGRSGICRSCGDTICEPSFRLTSLLRRAISTSFRELKK